MDPKGHEPAITPVEQKTDNQALAEKLEKISENQNSAGYSTQGETEIITFKICFNITNKLFSNSANSSNL